MNTTDKYTDSDWEKLAAYYAGENINSAGTELPEGDDAVLMAGKIWNKLDSSKSPGIINTDEAWKKVSSAIGSDVVTKNLTSGTGFHLKPFMKAAAAIVLLAGIGSAFFWFTSRENSNSTVIASGEERNIEVTLPDGSRVWLNRNSELSYSKSFDAQNRNVKLTGEAFFDVKRDESKPFVIDAGTGTVTVLGTSFNVISSNSNKQLEVLVETGKVKISDNGSGKSLTLEPGFLGRINSNFSEATRNDNRNYISWKTDLLVYNGERLGTIISDLKRVHNVDITVADQAILNNSYFGVFDKLPHDTIVKIICTTFNLDYIKEGEKYTLKR
jgi:ferric-dicitrate binding protein FerR (iron transport regulator)